jgi:glycogen debranching enzyme
MTIPTHSRSFYFEEEASLSSTMTASRAKSPKNKRKLRFRLESNETFIIPHVDDLDEQEIQSVWYDRTDYETMKTSFIPIIRRMMKEERIEETNTETIRGLEFRTRQGALRRQHKIDSTTKELLTMSV